MKVAVITTSYPQSPDDAAGHFVRSEVRALERGGCNVHVFVPRGPAFGWPGVVERLREEPWRAVSASIELACLRTTIAKHGPYDRIVAHWLPTALLAPATAGELEVVVHGTDVHILTKLPKLARSWLVSFCLRRATRVRVVSASLAEQLLAHVPATERAATVAKLRVQPCAIDLPDVSERKRALRAGMGERRLAVCVARLIPSKRVDRAIEHIAEGCNDTVLAIIGDGPERDRLEAQARVRGVDVQFLGQLPRPDALGWIAAADVLLHASIAEGASTVLREAEALGTPTIIF